MADTSNPLGNLAIGITGDFSDLESQLEGAQEAAATAGQAIADAFTEAASSASTDQWEEFANSVNSAFETASSGATGLTDSLGDVKTAADSAGGSLDSISDEALSTVSDAAAEATTSLSDIGDAADEASSSMDDLSDGVDGLDELTQSASEAATTLGDAGDAASEAAQGLNELSNSEAQAGAGAEEAEGGLAGLSEQLIAVGESLAITEGLKELGDEALEAADSITHAQIALGAITGSAETANETIEGLEGLGQTDGLSMPSLLTAATRMQQLLGPSADVVDVIESVADGAAIMGTSIDEAANMFDRMAASGMANARSLTTLGLSTTTLAAAINEVTGAESATADNASKMFTALDQASRVQALQTALEGLAGTAEDVANQTFGGQWTQLANAWEAVMVQAGQAILPVISDLVQFTKVEIVPFLQQIMEVFNTLPAPIKDTVAALLLLGPVVIAGTAALGALAIGINGLTGLIPNVISLVTSLAGAFTVETAAAEESVTANEAAAAAIGEEGLAASVASVGTAAASAAPLIDGIGVAAAGAGVAATGASEAAVATAVGFAGMGTAATAGLAAVVALGAAIALLQFKAYAQDVEDFGAALLVGVEQSAQYVASTSLVQSALGELGLAFNSVKVSWQDVLTIAENSNGPITAARAAFQGLTSVLQAYTQTGPQIVAMNAAVAASLQQFGAGNDVATKSATAAAMALAQQQLAGNQLSPSLDTLVQKAGALDTAFTNATNTLNAATTAYNNGQISLTAYNLAVDQYNKALAAVQASATAAKGSVDALNQSVATAQTTYQNAQQVFNQIQQSFQNGTASAALYAEAYAKVQSAAKAAGETFTDTNAAVEGSITAFNNQVAAATSDVEVWQQLTQLAGSGFPGAAIEASAEMTKLNSVLGQLGISVTEVGAGLQFATTASGAAAAAAQPLVGELNSLYGTTQDVIDVNGKLVSVIGNDLVGALQGATTSGGFAVTTLNNVADAAGNASNQIVVYKGSSDSAAQSSQNLAVAGNTAATALQNVTDQMNAAAQASLNAVDPIGEQTAAYNQLAQAADAAADAESSASSSSSSGGKGSKGVQMNLDYYASMYAGAAGTAGNGPGIFNLGGLGQGNTQGLTFSGTFADGGIVTQKSLAIVGEAGPEMIIPLSMIQTPSDSTSSALPLNSALQTLSTAIPDVTQLSNTLSTLGTALSGLKGINAENAINSSPLSYLPAYAYSQGGPSSTLGASSTPSTPYSGPLTTASIGSLTGSIDMNTLGTYAQQLIGGYSSAPGTGGTANVTPLSSIDLNTLGTYAQNLIEGVNTGPGAGGNAPVTSSGSSLPLTAAQLSSLAQYAGFTPAPGTVTNYTGGASPVSEATGTLGSGTTGNVTTQVTLSNNLIGSQQIANSIVNQVQAAVVTQLRQAGLKI